MRVLVVEDEQVLADAIAVGLRRELMAVDVAYDGAGALERATVNDYDVVVLDRDLPHVHGDQVCRELVAHNVPARVLMLTAATEVTDRVDGLQLGADDYLGKPFAFTELVARVRALLRRVDRARELAADGGTAGALELGPLRVDRQARRVSHDGAEVHLTPTEFDLLVCLGERAGQVLTREHLLARVWDWPDASGTRAVDSHVKSLRRKLGAELVRTVHGVGYALEPGA